MWAVIVGGLPLGVTPAALQRCIEEALNERPVFPQTPKISEDEALVYLPARDIQIRLSSPPMKLRCGGTVVKVKKVNKEQAAQWIAQRQPEKKQNPAPTSNIHKYLKQQKREQRKLNKKKGVPPGLKKGKERKIATRSTRSTVVHNATDEREREEVEEEEEQEEEIIEEEREEMEEIEIESDKYDRLYRYSLYDELPVFSTDNQNSIIWYQYLIFVTRKKTPFYVTYPAEWCWDIEGQWLKFQEHYAINPDEAEKVDSRFSIGEPNKHSNSHSMVGDLLNMKVTDNNTGHQYEFKRTNKLIGTLISYGQIQFERYYRSREKEIFLYDRKTGYHDSVLEDDLKLGDQIIFEAWWNKDDNDTYHYDVTDRINKLQYYIENDQNDHTSLELTIHFEMFAFNIKKADPEEEEHLYGSNKSMFTSGNNYQFDDYDDNRSNQQIFNELPLNPLLPNDMKLNATMQTLANSDPLIADDFRGIRFEGLLISLRRDDTGLIVCFPYENQPKKDLTLVFHMRFVKDSDRFRLSVNMNVEFSIGVNPSNFGQGLYGYVAMDIIITEHGFTNKFIPVTVEETNRQFKGKIIVAPKSIDKYNGCGFIYNPFNNNMCRLEIKSQQQVHDYRINMYVRYNEFKIENSNNNNNNNERDKYYINALDVIPVKKINIEKINQSYYTSDNFVRYKAKRYIYNRKLKIDEDRNIEFKNVKLKRNDYKNYSDLYLIIEQCETYLNAFLNTSGGAIFFGIRDDGTIVGQEGMTKNKRDYIRNAIGQRVNHFKPSVPSEYYNVEFKEVIDIDGYCIVNNYVIIIHVAKLYTGDNIEQHVKFSTSQGQIYERRITSVGTTNNNKSHAQLTHINPQHHQQLYNKRKSLGITSEVKIGVKPQFITFDCIDDNNEQNENDNEQNDNDNDNDSSNNSTESSPYEKLHSNNNNNLLIIKDPKLIANLNDSDSSSQEQQNNINQQEQKQDNNNNIIVNDNFIGIDDNSNNKNDKEQQQQQQQQLQLQSQQDEKQHHHQIYYQSQRQAQQITRQSYNTFGNMNVNINTPIIQYTTPELNAKPIPPNTEQGRIELAQRVQLKLNEMMMITEYMIDPRWQSILTMASSNLYNAQKTTWMLMKNLEQEKIRQNIRQRQLILQQQQQKNENNNNNNNNKDAIHQIRDISTHELINDYNNNNQNQNQKPTDKPTEILINNNKYKDKEIDKEIDRPSIGQKYASALAGAEPEIDSHGLPILPDKSKYKAVAMEYCQKMGWKRPVEAAQCVGAGYRATVTFGKPGKEKSASGDGLRQKNAIYEAYIKLVPVVIPKNSAIELMIKWVPGYKKQEKITTATIAQSGQSIMKHPKSVLLEWAQKNSIAPPKTIFSEFADSARNMRIWTAKVTFCGKTIESKGSKKKDAESKCFQELLKHVMNGGITKHKQ